MEKTFEDNIKEGIDTLKGGLDKVEDKLVDTFGEEKVAATKDKIEDGLREGLDKAENKIDDIFGADDAPNA